MKIFTTYKHAIPVVFIITALLSIAVIVQLKYDKIMHPQIIFTTETRYILPATIVKNFSFGFKNVLADLYWVKAIQDFSIWDGKDSFYLQEYENIATLDPRFSYSYILGILTFTSKSVTDKSIDPSLLESIEPIIQVGIKNIPDNWEIPFYLGTGFQLIKNPERALHYLKIAASQPSAPTRVSEAYKSYLKNTITGEAASRLFIKTIYETTESETTKKILEEGVMVNDLTDILTTVVNNYKTKYGFFPASIDELINHKMIKPGSGSEIQKRFNIRINQQTGEVKITAKKVQ
jgi:hypothetical protein